MPSYQPFRIEHLDAALELWRNLEGIGLSESDTPERIGGFLERNPGLSFVAFDRRAMVGTILCGHDGRRGYIYHLAVAPAVRRGGVARRLLEMSLQGLADAGVLKCHAFVFSGNPYADLFWSPSGWERRDDLLVFSRSIAPPA